MSSIQSSTPVGVNDPGESAKSKLWPEHVQLLQARGISAEFAQKHGLFSINVGKFKAHLNKYGLKAPWPHLPLYDGATGIGLPYQVCLDAVQRIRIRADNTEVVVHDEDNPGSDHGPRYICQAKPVTVAPYIPAEVFEIAGNTTKPVFVVEAPLKSLSLTEHGFPAIGLGGVLAGATDVGVLDTLGEIVISPELNRIKWTGRTVYVVFDAGLADNPMVALGAARLAVALQGAEANVQVVNIPYYHPTDSDPENGAFYCKTDQGPDDFLQRSGVEEFKKLVDAAVPADLVARFKSAAEGPNKTEAVARLLGDLLVQAVLHEGGALLVDQVAVVSDKSGIKKRAVQQAVSQFGERMRRRVTKDESTKQPFSRGDQVEVAERLVSSLSNGGLVYADGVLHQYTAGVWNIVDPHEVSRAAQDFVGSPIVGTQRVLRLNANDVRGAIALAQDRIGKPKFFDGAVPGLAFNNGFVQVSKNGIELLAHSPSQKARTAYPFDYVKEGSSKPERLLAMLERFFGKDPDAAAKIAVLQEYGGMSLIGQGTTGERVVLLLGAGNDGKSTFANVLRAAFPKGSVIAIAPQELSHEYKKAVLVGKLMNICTEMPERDILDSSGLKAVTGRDGVLGRHPAGRPFEFIPKAGHLYAANRLPSTNDTTRGFRRRFIILEFNETLEASEVIDRLEDEIVAQELPEIVAWFLEGAARRIASGRYTIPQSSAAAMDRWMLRSCSVASFVDEATVPAATPDEYTPAKLLYKAYKDWCAENGIKNAVASNTFGERLKHLIKRIHTKSGNTWGVQAKAHACPVTTDELEAAVAKGGRDVSVN